ncbi:PREDICTED: E3 ubiquitin-protein ligase PUB23-like [Populus euphratica]|uniref:U-box domain-containing protein n=1 Tax=Populus euphratica TaxID=75702 RepID=A0AAJ6V0Z6_POPEU|nr:PREDICTED: E3 ubiquitin-protein ligase PUB23-like [Populus euphratica]
MQREEQEIQRMDGSVHHIVPSFFICPISLQIMKDPVTISTGMTFDRESIQKWLFSYKNIACPITKQPLSDFRLTPNSNLRRLIQSWHLQHASSSTTKFAEPNHDSLMKLLLEEIKQPHLQITGNYTTVIAEAVSLLCLLSPSDEALKMVSQKENGLLICSLCSIMTRYLSNLQLRIQAALVLKSIFEVVDDIYKEGLKFEFFENIIEILKDQNSKHGSMAVLAILIRVLSYGKNKEKAIKGGCIPILIELLAEENERHVCEMMLVVLEKLCQKAEGRAAFLSHPAGMAAVVSKILKVSHVGDDKSISLLSRVLRFCTSSGEAAQEFMEVGGMTKICLVIQSGCNSKTKEKAREILGFHFKTWNKSPCFPSSFKA